MERYTININYKEIYISECRWFSADLEKDSMEDSAKDNNELPDSLQLEKSWLSAFKKGLFHGYDLPKLEKVIWIPDKSLILK